jgi:DIE2/ALG10 family
MQLNKFLKSMPQVLFLGVLCLLYLILFCYLDNLQFPPMWDEIHFWQTTLRFSENLVPSLSLLRNYGELNTPLPFIFFGFIEHLFKGGIFVGRLLNLILSFAMTYLIGQAAITHGKNPFLVLLGLMLFPYYLWSSGYFYTDIMAAFFVFLGFWFYQRERDALSSIAFVLAIASRQYMLAFPLAIAAYELLLTYRDGFKLNRRWLAPLFAAGSILGWILLFGGLAPQAAFSSNGLAVPVVQQSLGSIGLSSSLYFLSCVGFYFVGMEWLLFSRKINLRNLITRKNCFLAFCFIILFILFPPLETHGLLGKGLEIFPREYLKLCSLCGLALVAAIRFEHFNLAFWLLLTNCGIMLKAYPWDKYLLPLLVVFWYLKAIDRLDVKLDKHARIKASGGDK